MKKILVVDDEPSILESLSYLLNGKEVLVVTCDTMEEAEKALSKYVFELVIADIRLSGMQGVEGLEILKYVKDIRPETEVIIITAYGSEEMMRTAHDRGAYRYYEKPLDLDELMDAVRAIGLTGAGQK